MSSELHTSEAGQFGAEVGIVCTRCGAESPSDREWCLSCGVRMAPPKKGIPGLRFAALAVVGATILGGGTAAVAYAALSNDKSGGLSSQPAASTPIPAPVTGTQIQSATTPPPVATVAPTTTSSETTDDDATDSSSSADDSSAYSGSSGSSNYTSPSDLNSFGGGSGGSNQATPTNPPATPPATPATIPPQTAVAGWQTLNMSSWKPLQEKGIEGVANTNKATIKNIFSTDNAKSWKPTLRSEDSDEPYDPEKGFAIAIEVAKTPALVKELEIRSATEGLKIRVYGVTGDGGKAPDLKTATPLGGTKDLDKEKVVPYKDLDQYEEKGTKKQKVKKVRYLILKFTGGEPGQELSLNSLRINVKS